MTATNSKDNKDSLKMATVDSLYNRTHHSVSLSYPHHSNSYNNNSLLLGLEDNDPLLVQERLSALGKRLVHYEAMFQTLNNKLEQHFKKYDTIIQSQQQQIGELNSTISLLLNDRMKNAGSLKEKLSDSSIGGMPSHVGYFNDMSQYQQQQQQQTDMSNMINNTHILFDTHSTEDLLQEILTNETSNISTPITAAGTNPAGDQINLQSQSLPMDIHAAFIKETYESVEKPTDSKDPPESHNNSSDNNNNNTGSKTLDKPSGSKTGIQVNSIPASTSNSESKIRKIRYQSNETLKESKPIHQFKFIRSPHSVKEIWREYVEGVKGQPSVKEMDSRYHSTWRKDPAVSKRYSRRRVLCKAIENGLTRGYDLETVIELLENHRMVDQERGIKQPLGWLCQPSNIPQTFK